MAFVSTQECPPPVARYFDFAIHEDQPLIQAAHVIQAGEMRLGPDQDWKPFEAEQCFAVNPPGFLWKAKMRVAPLISLFVQDAYFDEEGSMKVSILRFFPILHQRAIPEMNASALQRYLAEAVWFPTALLPGNGVEWTPANDTTARATLRHGDTIASLYFHFNDTGEISGVSTPGRYRKVGHKFELTPWAVLLREHKERDGFRVPTTVEVEWLLPEGPFCWFRAKVLDIQYEWI